MNRPYKNNLRICLAVTVVLLTAYFSGCVEEEEPEIQTCDNLTFKENVIVNEEDAIYEDLFDCFENADAGVKAFGGVAYDVGFSNDGTADCVQLYKEDVVPRSDLEPLQQCQLDILKQATANDCPDCGLRGYGFLLCFDEFSADDCNSFVAETR